MDLDHEILPRRQLPERFSEQIRRRLARSGIDLDLAEIGFALSQDEAGGHAAGEEGDEQQGGQGDWDIGRTDQDPSFEPARRVDPARVERAARARRSGRIRVWVVG
jgi:hypothetical protein